MQLYIHACTYLYIYMYVHLCIYECYTHTYLCIHTCTSRCIHANVCVLVCVCTHVRRVCVCVSKTKCTTILFKQLGVLQAVPRENTLEPRFHAVHLNRGSKGGGRMDIILSRHLSNFTQSNVQGIFKVQRKYSSLPSLYPPSPSSSKYTLAAPPQREHGPI